MLAIPGYQILAKIYESHKSLVFRGIREQDEQPVILKLLQQDYPTPEELIRYKQEYDITSALNLEGVIKATDWRKYYNSFVIIFEDFGGDSLKNIMESRQFLLAEVLELSSQIAEILERVHSAKIIHKDINPSNIVLNPETGQVKLIDFGISTLLTCENPALKNPLVLEGTLSYISPEQTGRMNRVVDYRTDFYSLGVTFYELLTHCLPFTATDAMELVHCHIAKQPVPPHEIAPEIPRAVSDIVMKLLAKTAEERYQSAPGIKADLDECLRQLQETGKIGEFPLARQDISDKFYIPQKLYGRESEVETLLTALVRVAPPEENRIGTVSGNHLDNSATPRGTSEIVLVSGYSGIGKTSLVQEIYKPITRSRGYFIAGKFDQYQRNIPYSAVAIAFSDLVRQLLTESEEKLSQWRSQLAAALGANGQAIADLIPEIELIFGQQPSLPELPPAESQNRLRLAFQNFIRVFALPEHPLVIFLDDLQWADAASLKLIQILMEEPDRQCLLLIGAYRDNEVSSAHPLMLAISEIQKQGANVRNIRLVPLQLHDVNTLISDTLRAAPEKTLQLAKLVLAKTGGNPFFINEFLKQLYADGLLKFECDRRGWEWDVEQIKARNITENVVELMAGKIQKLPPSAREVLVLAACIGDRFDLLSLTVAREKSLKETASDLREAIAEGLIVPLGDRYKSAELDLLTATEGVTIACRFAHDRIQQAAYSLISDSQKQALHLLLGRRLLRETPPEKREEKIFDIANHLNFGLELISDREEREELARLNAIAGQKAKASAAYETALAYLQIGIKLLEPASWERQYDLTLKLHVEASKAAYLSGEYEEMQRLAEIVLQRAATLLDKVSVCEVKLQAYIAQNRQLEAIATALSVLKLLGVSLPEKPRPWNILLGLFGTKLVLAGKRVQDFIDLPQMTDPIALAAARVLVTIVAPAYNALPEILPLIAFKLVNLSVRYGNCEASALGYAVYALILCGVVGDIETGYHFGQLSLRLLAALDAKELKPRTSQIVNCLVAHWKEPMEQTLQPSLEAYTSGLEIGDLEYAALGAHTYCYHSYFIGKELGQLAAEMAAYNQAIARLNQTFLNFNKIFYQAVLNLTGDSETPYLLVGEAYSETEMLDFHRQANDRTALGDIYINKLVLCYLFAEYFQAIEQADSAEKYLDGLAGTALVPVFYFYDSLARLAVHPDMPKPEQKRVLQKVNANQKNLKKWASYAPENLMHKFYLVEAERYRVLGDISRSRDYFDRACELAKERQYIHEEALASELAAKFYLNLGKANLARTYMQEALYCYVKWGAARKVKDLQVRYPQLLKFSEHSDGSLQQTVSSFPTSVGHGNGLDLTTVMKASQAISGEIVLDKLLAKLMQILIENAGAQKGYLILESQGKLLIEASGTAESDRVAVLESVPIKGSQVLSPAIVNYVARTKETVVLNDAVREGRFTHDPYIREHQPKSILCAPLLNRGQLAGILYLENNLTTCAFPPERLAVLQLLSTQAAISIANARLYGNLEKALDAEVELTDAYGRFVPHEFLYFLGCESILDVQLGNGVQQEMSVLFADIRDFTTLSESMTPEDNFRFLNAYLSRMQPAIAENNGFIDKYIGDAIMALFSGSADDAVKAGISMLQRLDEYNITRGRPERPQIRIGIGINTGSLMLGTVGGANRMEGTAIGDTVNLASRVESLTKEYGVSMLITHQTFSQLRDPVQYAIRIVDRVKVKGKSQTVSIFEVFDADPPEIRAGKLATERFFLEAVLLYKNQYLREAKQLFEECLRVNPMDSVAQIYAKRCQQHRR